MRAHCLTDQEFDDIAGGYGTASGVAALRGGQLSRRLLMLIEIANSVRSPWLDDACDLLAEVQARAPGSFADSVGSPGFGTWSALAMQAVRGADRQTPAILDQLGSFAATAAIRAGLDFAIDLPATDHAVFLPGLGRAATDEPRVTVRGKVGEYLIGDVHLPVDPAHDAAGWVGLRRSTTVVDGLRLDVVLDDLDPWRDNHGLRAAGRRADAEIAQWRRLLREAWEALVRHHPRYARAIAAGLHTVVPLSPPRAGNTINATSMWAFGSVSLTLPTSGLTLASSLLHEFQHAKLGALLDLFQMYEDDGARRFYAPWRDDPRPLSGLLQGVYAFMGVTDFWRVRRRVADDEGLARVATLEFARWRDQVWRTFQTLESSDAFTPEGRRFLDGMRATQVAWLDDDVPATAAELSTEFAADHWTAWRLRNVRLDPDDELHLVSAWASGQPAPRPVRSSVVPHDVRARARNPRLDLAALRVRDPEAFAGTCGQASVAGSGSAADIAYACGDYDAAIAGYRALIRMDPDHLGSWAGLAMACRRADSPAAGLWLTSPEVPFAVHRALRAAGAPVPDPVQLADWLSAGQAGQVGGGSTMQ